MELQAYKKMATTEDTHWWFVGRRAISSRVIGSLGLPPDAAILEVGAGTGGNITMLGRYGSVTAVEMNDFARDVAARKTGIPILKGYLPDGLPFHTANFDLICLFDVLEHVTDDLGSLLALRPLLKPGGHLLLTVPAHQWLWSSHDEELHHARRYSKSLLQEVLAAAGYRVRKLSFFNAALFPAAMLARLGAHALGTQEPPGTGTPPPAVNWLLSNILLAEGALISVFRLPFGLSLLAVVR